MCVLRGQNTLEVYQRGLGANCMNKTFIMYLFTKASKGLNARADIVTSVPQIKPRSAQMSYFI